MNSPKDYLTDREKLMEKIVKIMDAHADWLFAEVGPDHTEMDKEEALQAILSLLTSEVEKAEKKLIDEVDKLIEGGKDEMSGTYDYDRVTEIIMQWVEMKKDEQRKALSDIGGGHICEPQLKQVTDGQYTHWVNGDVCSICCKLLSGLQPKRKCTKP